MFLDKSYQNFKKKSYVWRAKYFKPVLKLLARIKITPNKITSFRLIFVLPIVFYFYHGNLLGVLIFYLIFWTLDLVDGALARYLQTSNDKGRFLDSVVDNFMYAVLILGFIYLNVAPAWLLAYNIAIELFVQMLATIKKRYGQKSDWLISVTPDLPWFKSISHAVLLIYFFGFDYLTPVYYILNIGLTVTALHFYFLIRKTK